jgi:N-glycosylase/DNA lyase
LCRSFGEKKTDTATGTVFYTFPSPESLGNAKKEALREAGLGYRDEYVRQTAQAVARGDIDFNSLQASGYEEAVKELMKLSGVGIKVANCVALYGLHHIDAFPVDVWIDRILRDIYHNKFDVAAYKGYAGIVQQYMFYYIRSL